MDGGTLAPSLNLMEFVESGGGTDVDGGFGTVILILNEFVEGGAIADGTPGS